MQNAPVPTVRRQNKEREYQNAKRRAEGRQTRADYLANSLSLDSALARRWLQDAAHLGTPRPPTPGKCRKSIGNILL
jgi:hypothetical protein